MAKPITFLSDFGSADEFVGVVHAVIARECPQSHIIDLVHGVPRHAVLTGALMLARALPFAPPGVHLAVVDPGVGGSGVRSPCAPHVRTGCWSAPTTAC